MLSKTLTVTKSWFSQWQMAVNSSEQPLPEWSSFSHHTVSCYNAVPWGRLSVSLSEFCYWVPANHHWVLYQAWFTGHQQYCCLFSIMQLALPHLTDNSCGCAELRLIQRTDTLKVTEFIHPQILWSLLMVFRTFWNMTVSTGMFCYQRILFTCFHNSLMKCHQDCPGDRSGTCQVEPLLVCFIKEDSTNNKTPSRI